MLRARLRRVALGPGPRRPRGDDRVHPRGRSLPLDHAHDGQPVRRGRRRPGRGRLLRDAHAPPRARRRSCAQARRERQPLRRAPRATRRRVGRGRSAVASRRWAPTGVRGLDSDDPAVRWLLDRAEIHDLLVQYALGVDQRDYERIRRCFAPGFHAAYGDREFDDLDELCAFISGVEHFHSTTHFLGTQLIEVAAAPGTDEAWCSTASLITHRPHEDDAEAEWVAVGRYVDRLARVDGAWRIVERGPTAHDGRPDELPAPDPRRRRAGRRPWSTARRCTTWSCAPPIDADDGVGCEDPPLPRQPAGRARRRPRRARRPTSSSTSGRRPVRRPRRGATAPVAGSTSWCAATVAGSW